MSDATEPVPQRIGDAERDRAVDLLRDHMTAGRLDAGEFDERLDAALTARTSSELDRLFTDLPGPRPGQGLATTAPYTPPPWQGAQVASTPATDPAPVAPPAERNALLAVLTAVMWPVTILLITFALGWDNYWWLVFVPIIISSAMGKEHHNHRERERARIERDQRELDRRRRQLGD